MKKHAPRDKQMSDICRVAWGRLLMSQQDFRAAAEVLLAAKDRTEYDVEYLTGVAHLFQYEPNKEALFLLDAQNHFKLAVENHPSNWWARVNLLLTMVLIARHTSRDPPLNRFAECVEAIDAAVRETPKLFSLWMYKLLLYSIIDDRSQFDEVASESRRQLGTTGVERPKNFPHTMMRRVELVWSHSDDVLEYYRREFLVWIVSLSQ